MNTSQTWVLTDLQKEDCITKGMRASLDTMAGLFDTRKVQLAMLTHVSNN